MISVIIATRDRAPLLASVLEALSQQEWPGCPFEIVVVDNGSVDDTRTVVATAAARSAAPIVYLREDTPGKSHALNAGVSTARGNLLVFTDDDMLPCSKDWLAAYIRALADTGADYATGRILPLWEAAQPRWLSPLMYGAIGVSDGGTRRLNLSKGLNEQIMALGGNMAVRRPVLDRIGGWNPNLGKLQGTLRTGEDHEFALRMAAAGFTGVYEPRASMYHRVPGDRLRLGYFSRWFFDNGGIAAGLEHAYPSTTRLLLRVPRYLWRQLADDLAGASRGLLTADLRRVTAAHMRCVWFAGYLRSRWTRHGRGARLHARPVTLSRS
jgi:glycosyltransferase involved in cell wall biosynthesis